MIGADARSLRNGARQFSQRFAVPLNPAPIRNAPILFLIRTIEIPAAALRYLDRRMVVLLRDLRDQVVDAAWPHLQTSLGQRPFGRHRRLNLRVWIARATRVRLNFRSAE